MFDGKKKQVNRGNLHNRRKIRSPEEIKKIGIIITIILSVFLVVFLFIRRQYENYNNIKQNKNSYLVYSKYEKTNNDYAIYVPFINIKGDAVSAVNEDIELFTKGFIESKKSKILYEYDINGIFLSLVIKIVDYSEEYAPKVYFRSYNINLDTLEIISDDSLLQFFGITYSDVENVIENDFHYYYQEIVNEEYYHTSECNYECFLKYREVSNYMDDVSYYIKDGNLIAYKSFVFASIYGEEEYFDDDDFEFLLVESEKE